ncbi:MAG TPA: FHA domain-containing protein [Blastocatellia bacterium]|nr:FHA domain-containing protein [Blastocatellia bacterium]
MSSCPRCGARNNANLDACRLCGTFLGIERAADSPVEQIDTNSPTVVVPVGNAAPQPGKGAELVGPAGEGSEAVACPFCQTANEVGWSFCQHCGKKLPPREAQPREVPPTADRPAPPDPKAAQDLKSPQDLITVVVEAERLGQGAPEMSPPQGQAPASQAADAPSPSSALTEEARVPAPAEPAGGGLFCPQCGKQNSINNSYCSVCGGPIPVAETVAMTSVPVPPRGRLRLIMEGGQEGDLFELKDETVVGRTSGDIAFPHDGFMSGRHARIIRRGSSFILKDEGSRNGTFVKIRGEVELQPGDVVLIGKQLFKFEL